MDHRILIADDDLDVRQGAAELLAGIGLEVVQAEDGSEALGLVRASFANRRPLHLVLADVHMPGPRGAGAGEGRGAHEGGLALFDALRVAAPKLPCILWSGEASAAVEAWALGEGVSAFLRKPVQPHLLRTTVRGVLDKHWSNAG